MPKKQAPAGAPPGVPGYLSITQLAERIGVNRKTVYDWRRRGVLMLSTYAPPGSNLVRYRTADADTWWAAQRRDPR